MLNRKILDDFAQWAAREERKSLVLHGARQDREIFERSLPFPELVQVMFLARNESPLELMMARDAQVSQMPAFWVRESKASTAEVDFVLPCRGFLIPAEVKAGSSGTLRSLHQFVDQADHPWAVRLYSGPLRRDAARTQRGKDYQLLSRDFMR